MRGREGAWKRWERDVCKMLDVAPVIASGSTDGYKGDAKGKDILIDAKYTSTRWYALRQDTWKKLASWARNESRRPVLAIRVDSGDENMDGEFVVIEESYYCELFGMDTSSEDAPVRVTHSINAQSVLAMPFFTMCNTRLAIFSAIGFYGLRLDNA